MDEPLSELIPRLERQVRFWRSAFWVLLAIMLSGLVSGLFFFGVERQRVLRAVDEAMLARKEAGEVAAAAARQAEQALREAREPKKD
jgi:hypothetical protein